MSYLVSGLNGIPAPVVDPRIKPSIFFQTTTNIPPEICNAMALVIKAVADQLQQEGRSMGNQPINCIFSDTDRFSIAVYPSENAVCMRLAFYPLGGITPFLGSAKLYTILAEELCHLIWDISDEVEVNFKVLAVLRHLNADFQMADLYGPEAVRACETYLKDHPAFQP